MLNLLQQQSRTMSAILIFPTVCLLMCVSSLTAGDKDAEVVSKAELKFSTELFQKIVNEHGKNENVFFSPYSIFNAFLTVLVAAAGKTETQVQDFLRIDKSAKLGRDYFIKNHLHSSFHHSKEYELTSADRIYHSDDIKEKPDKIKIFGDKVVTFKSGTDRATQINNWVSEITKGNIKDLFKEKSIPPGTALDIVNAVYFQGIWTHPFNTLKTHKRKFLTATGGFKETHFMTNTDSSESASSKYQSMTDNELKAQIISLPYKGEDISMIIILPTTKPSKNQPSTIPDIVKKLTGPKLQALETKLHSQKQRSTDLLLPKFDIKLKYDLLQILKSLGPKELFTEPVDLTYLFSNEHKVPIGSVLHGAFVKVYEAGTTAGAATAITIGSSARETEFHADHPFIFIIYDKARQYAHYMGVFNSPSE